MSLATLPYPNMDFVPLDILTANELDQIVANIDAVNNAQITSAQMSNNAVTSAKIADGAVSFDKIDWTTFGRQHTTSSTSVTIGTSATTMESFSLTAGTWLLIGTSDFNHNNSSTGDSYLGFWNTTTNNSIGNMFYFNEVDNGTWFNTITVHEVVTLTATSTVAFVARKTQGTLASSRRSFTAIRIA